MDIQRADLTNCHTAAGLVVAIDVIRAFTTAAYLFDEGVSELILASTVEEAFDLRQRLPGTLIFGEVNGVPVPGFDYGNSPSRVLNQNLRGRRGIQRTTAGTQGVLRAASASIRLAAALPNAAATARYIQQLNPASVTLIVTGYRSPADPAEEDEACAEAIERLLTGQPVDWAEIERRVRLSKAARSFDGTQPHFPPRDLDLAASANVFNFAMRVEREDGLNVMRKVEVEG